MKKPFQLGGLGVRSMVEVYRARYEASRRKTTTYGGGLLRKYGTEVKGWFTRLTSRPHGTGLWKKICMGKRQFYSCIRWKIGTGP